MLSAPSPTPVRTVSKPEVVSTGVARVDTRASLAVCPLGGPAAGAQSVTLQYVLPCRIAEILPLSRGRSFPRLPVAAPAPSMSAGV